MSAWKVNKEEPYDALRVTGWWGALTASVAFAGGAFVGHYTDSIPIAPAALAVVVTGMFYKVKREEEAKNK